MHILVSPQWVRRLLSHEVSWLLARLLLTSAYVLGGVTKVLNWPAALAEQASFGLSPPNIWAAITVTVELGGSLLLLIGRGVWLAAGALGVFTFFAAILANAFWLADHGPGRFSATNAFFEHLGLVGGFILAAMVANQKQT